MNTPKPEAPRGIDYRPDALREVVPIGGVLMSEADAIELQRRREKRAEILLRQSAPSSGGR